MKAGCVILALGASVAFVLFAGMAAAALSSDALAMLLGAVLMLLASVPFALLLGGRGERYRAPRQLPEQHLHLHEAPARWTVSDENRQQLEDRR